MYQICSVGDAELAINLYDYVVPDQKDLLNSHGQKQTLCVKLTKQIPVDIEPSSTTRISLIRRHTNMGAASGLF